MNGTRFEFGQNWNDFAKKIDENRIDLAMTSVLHLLKTDSLKGKSFLDIGCGSGLFSVAAKKLGADVHAFDYDEFSVQCTRALKEQTEVDFSLQRGSILDDEFVQSLGTYDYVYSWGVLHHTGDMQKALINATKCVKPSGFIALAIYNDQGRKSRIWLRIKRFYNYLPKSLKLPYLLLVGIPIELINLIGCGGPVAYYKYVKQYPATSLRGMSKWNDLVDWIGGYPFEVAKPEQIFDFFTGNGFTLVKLKTCGGGLGCNEFLFRRCQQST